MKKVLFLTVLILIIINIPIICSAEDFSDVNKDHWAYYSVNKLKNLNITQGMGNNEFGIGRPVKRSEFTAMLVRLMNWEITSSQTGTFNDNKDKNKWYFHVIETAVKQNMIDGELEYFRPDDYITRNEMAEMIVRALGFYNLSQELNKYESDFSDVTKNIGIINIAKDLGIISGMGDGTFAPDNNALREHAAAMMIRMYDKINTPLNNIHGFYAINSYEQKDFIRSLDSVGFGWAQLEYNNTQDRFLITTSNLEGFNIPKGYEELLQIADSSKTDKNLMIYASNIYNNNLDDYFLDYILSSTKYRQEVINSIIGTLKNNIFKDFNGVVIDFELIRFNSKNNFNIFIDELESNLNKIDKSLIIAVHPITKGSHYDGYDYKFLGHKADSIILMAHDYSNKILSESEIKMGYSDTPLTPFAQIYNSLKEITNTETGVNDLNKVYLQFSFDSIQWKKQNNRVINKQAYRPDYDLIYNRLLKKDTSHFYSEVSQNPYAKYYNIIDNTENIIWYENTDSIKAKIKIAKMFGINNISLWRLGNIPNFNNKNLDIWKQIIKLK